MQLWAKRWQDGFLASGDWDDEQQAEIDQWMDGEEDDR